MTFSAPWECDDDFHIIFDASGEAVAFLPIPPDPATVRLLLAAPRLMAILEAAAEDDVVQWHDATLLKATRALIAEIRGDGS